MRYVLYLFYVYGLIPTPVIFRPLSAERVVVGGVVRV